MSVRDLLFFISVNDYFMISGRKPTKTWRSIRSDKKEPDEKELFELSEKGKLQEIPASRGKKKIRLPDTYLFFKNTFSEAGALDRIVSFINTTENPSVERLLIPDMSLTAAEYFAVQKHEKVLVLLTDMTNYADALAIVSNRMDQIPSKDSMPGSIYSDLAKIYEKAVQFPDGGSITIIAVTTLSGGDITHAVPDNTGYITEGQLYLRRDSDIGKVIVDPFRSLSRLKQLVTGTKTRKDHPQVMNAAVRLYADAANAKTKLENGFDLTDYDNRTLAFAKDYSEKLLAIDVNLNTTEMLDVAWDLFAKYFTPAEVNIKQELVNKYWRN
jgi:V/A-type H+-transporting ATPase subunit B